MLYQVFGGVAARTRQFVPFVQGARSQFTYDEKFLSYAKIASFCCIWIRPGASQDKSARLYNCMIFLVIENYSRGTCCGRWFFSPNLACTNSSPVFLFKMFLSGCPGVKDSFTIRKNFFPKLVATFLLKGGLCHVIFRRLVENIINILCIL